MPKLADVMFREQGPDGTRYEETFPCSVDAKKGFFTLQVDLALYEVARHMQETKQITGLSFTIKYANDRPRNQIHADSLDHLKRMVGKAVGAMLETTVSRAPVIQYLMSSTCHFWEMPDGTILPNGGYDINANIGNGGHPDRGYWSASNRETNGGPYGVSIYAKVAIKETHTNSSGKVTHKYVSIDTREFPDYVGKLNGFTHMLPDQRKVIREMPYTDEAGEFFFNMVNGMCMMAQRMHAFFGDDAALQKAIENKVSVTPKLGYTGV